MRNARIHLTALTIAGAIALAIPGAASAKQVRLVVELRPAATTSVTDQARVAKQAHGAFATSSLLGARQLTVSAPSTAAALARVRADADVAWAEPVVYFHHEDAYVPNDPFFVAPGSAGQWYLTQLHADAAWNLGLNSTGQGIKVAVVDSGVDALHPELTGKVLPGLDVPSSLYGQIATDDIEGHGTMIAGLIAGIADNAQGISGEAPQAQIIPVKIDDGQGNDSSFDLARGIVWAANDGARVINVSLGSDYDSKVVHNAVKFATGKGIVVVCAAGNHDPGESAAVTYPAAYPESLAVGALTQSSTLASFSNTGPSLDVSAPGVGIISTVPLSVKKRGYDVEDGTSFAAPIVAGLAALLAGRGLTGPQIIANIEAGAHPLGAHALFGAGEIDDLTSMSAAQPAPVAHAADAAPACVSPAATPLVDVTVPASGAIAVPLLCTDPEIDPFTFLPDATATAGPAGSLVANSHTPYTGTLTFTASAAYAGATLNFGATDGLAASAPASVVVAAPLTPVSSGYAAAAAVASLRKHLKSPRILRDTCKAVTATQQNCNLVVTVGTHGVAGSAIVSHVAIGATTGFTVEFDGFNATHACIEARSFPDCATPLQWSTSV